MPARLKLAGFIVFIRQAFFTNNKIFIYKQIRRC